jgi:tetratricopeptide (TPR) repeat protein
MVPAAVLFEDDFAGILHPKHCDWSDRLNRAFYSSPTANFSNHVLVFHPWGRSSKKAFPDVSLHAPGSTAVKGPGVADRPDGLEACPTGLNDRWTMAGVGVFLAAIIWGVFGQTLRYAFVNYDDNVYVYDNPEVALGLTLPGIVRAFSRVQAGNWHPLTWISHMLDCQLYGLNPGGHHLTNLLLHTTAAILLFLVVRRMTGCMWRSALVAAVFAIHPLRVESVAWVAERKDVLSGVFFMLTLGAYVSYARHAWSPARYGLVALLMALGLMCKPMLVTLPFVLLLLDYWPLNRWRTDDAKTPVLRLGGRGIPRGLVLEKLPLLGLAAASCAATLFAQTVAIRSFEEISLPTRVGNALLSCVIYPGQMFWPSGLAVFYPFPANGGPRWEIILAAALLLLITAGVIIVRKTRPYLLVGWLWYLVMLTPVIGILQVGSQAHADRYTYLPQLGLYLALTWLAADWSTHWRHRRALLGAGSGILLAALMFGAHAQTRYWRNSESLWTHALACTPDNVIAHTDLGEALLQQGRVDEAMTQFQQALQINPNYAEAHNNLGNVLLRKGRVDEALAQYQTALQIKSDYADAHYNLGDALLQKGRVDEAITQYQATLQIKSDELEAHNNLGEALLQKGRVDEAIRQFQKALEIKPDYANALNNLGYALLQKGGVDEAITHFQEALKIKSDYAEAHNNLGEALLQQGRTDEAIAHDQRALQLKPDYAAAHYNLGKALLQKGDAAEAITHLQKALRINPDYEEALNNLAWVLATCSQASLRDGRQAVELARRANQLAGEGSPIVLGGLAAAYAEAGRFSEAVEAAQRAVQLAGTQSNPALAEALSSQMKLYQTGRPFRIQ